ncbi:dispanin subfamily A member 2b-like [Hyla sarda]|uniref:dispanin subfamily A member 2b-like n=1 Tax=Hyla sarda TaxID=327740 RepID=UPI0024C3C111|nr:dispanin subfamily A member 2b-like [Hyla sarda]
MTKSEKRFSTSTYKAMTTAQSSTEGYGEEMYPPTTDVVTVQPGAAPHPPPPSDHLVWSIMNLICCCMPLGLAALIFSIKTRNAHYENDAPLAAGHSHTAKALNIAATVIGMVIIIIFLAIYFAVIFHFKPPRL